MKYYKVGNVYVVGCDECGFRRTSEDRGYILYMIALHKCQRGVG